jgi:hypothetical protein
MELHGWIEPGSAELDQRDAALGELVRETATDSCGNPCKDGCEWYNWCIRQPLHDGPCQCDKGHRW